MKISLLAFIAQLDELNRRQVRGGDARWYWLITLSYIVAQQIIFDAFWNQTLSRWPILFLLVVLCFYPLCLALWAKVNYLSLLKSSVWVLPMAFLIGITGGITYSLTLMLRSLLMVQAVLLMVRIKGFLSLCQALQRMGVPAMLASQLWLVYRYLFVLLREALSLQWAYLSISYGHSRLSIRVWSLLLGQLLLRSVARATRIHQAMLLRGFDGHISISRT